METLDGYETKEVASRLAAAVALYNEAAGPDRTSTFRIYENPDDAVPPIDTVHLGDAGEVYTRCRYPDKAALWGIIGLELKLSKRDSPPQI